MKKMMSILAFTVFGFTISCSQTPQPAQQDTDGAGIAFENTDHDFGTIPQGGDGTYEFIFRNTGKEPLILQNVRSSCGCTVPEWPKEPIGKGETGKIKVRYNTRITGSFSKSISVYSNAGNAPVVLIIKGKVEPAEN